MPIEFVKKCLSKLPYNFISQPRLILRLFKELSRSDAYRSSSLKAEQVWSSILLMPVVE